MVKIIALTVTSLLVGASLTASATSADLHIECSPTGAVDQAGGLRVETEADGSVSVRDVDYYLVEEFGSFQVSYEQTATGYVVSGKGIHIEIPGNGTGHKAVKSKITVTSQKSGKAIRNQSIYCSVR